LAAACGQSGKHHGENDADSFALAFATYDSCAEMQADVKAKLARKQQNDKQYMTWQGSAPYSDNIAEEAVGSAKGNDAQGSTSDAGQETFTNVQEKGVDEADH